MASRAPSPARQRQAETVTLVDLFSGIGGFSLGLEEAGFETVAFCEISPKCRHLLREHWPDVAIHEDVTTFSAAQVPVRVRAICGGFPCQDISFAGKGAGLAGERSGLWREYARLVREFRPDYVIVENVAALLGRGLGDVLGDLAALGYDAWWDCIPASAVGAPHRRDRLWIIAYSRGQQYEGYGDALRREIAARLSCASAMADPNLAGLEGRERSGLRQRAGQRPLGARRSSMADTDSKRLEGRGLPALPGQAIPYALGLSPADLWSRTRQGGWWSTEPDVGRVAHGVPARVDRLHGLGNAVVPQIPEILGRAILAAEAQIRQAAA